MYYSFRLIYSLTMVIITLNSQLSTFNNGIKGRLHKESALYCV